MADSGETARNVRDVMLENAYLFALFGAGIVLLHLGIVPEYRETLIVMGAAFIVASSIGIYMMITTRNVAKGLHARFDEQNDILREIAASQDKSLDIAASQNETLGKIAASQDKILDISSSQNETLGKIAASQKEIAASQKEIAASQKEIAASQRNVVGILRKIEEKITPPN